MQKPLFETSRFYLRELTAADASPKYLGWLKDQRANQFIETANETGNLESLRRYVQEKTTRSDVLFLGIFVRDSGLHIGNIKFEPLDSAHSSTVMGILIGDHEWRGKGVGAEVLNACAQWLFDHFGINKMLLGVNRQNTAGIKAYLKAGFRVIQEHDQDAAHVEAIHMVRLHAPGRCLALGTVQFGLRYGIANRSGQVDPEAATAILKHARGAGMDTLDTAITYGESERRLGEVGVTHWRVVSKLPPDVPADAKLANWARSSVLGAIERLRVPRLYGLLLHRSQLLVGPEGEALYRVLDELKCEGKIEKIGVSIYNPDELDALPPKFRLDLVQSPFNVLDRRLATSGWLKRLHEAGTEVHARSIFLQGLLLMDQARRPPYFSHWQSCWDQWHRWLKEQSLTPLQACLGFALSQPEFSRLIVGVDSLEQLQAILESAQIATPQPPNTLMSEDPALINPANWSIS